MTPPRLCRPAGTGLVLVMVFAAWAWRDCMLLATSVVLAHRLFLLRMDCGAPWRALAAAVNAMVAGGLSSLAGVALMAAVAAAWLGWWHPTGGHPAASLLMLSAGALWCCLNRDSRAGTVSELRLWLCVGGGAVVALEAQRSGLELAPCLFVATVAVAMLWAGWRLASGTASALLRAGSEMR